MAQADDDQSGGDARLAVELQEIRDWHSVSVREIAARWEQGLRGLLGLAGVAGLISAPLAAERLTGVTQVAVGVLLGAVLVGSGVGLVLVMSAAYGSVKFVRAPASAIELQALRWSLAQRARRSLLWGRGLAMSALVLFALAVVVAWLGPTVTAAPQLWIETESGVIHCGPELDAPAGVIAVRTDIEGRVEVPTRDVAALKIVERCEGADR